MYRSDSVDNHPMCAQQAISSAVPIRRRAPGGLVLAAGVVAALATVLPALARDGGTAADDSATAAALPDRVAAVLERTLANGGNGAAVVYGGDGPPPPQDDALRGFYGRRAFQPTWIGAQGPTERAMAVLAALRRADEDGLTPADYRPVAAADWMTIESLPERLAELELGLSQALLVFARDIQVGRFDPQTIDPELTAARAELGGTELLDHLASAEDPGRFLADLAPKNPYYHRLRRALSEHRAIEERGGWPSIDAGPNLVPGVRDARVAALRRRLEASGDLRAVGGDGRGDAGPDGGAGAGAGDLFDDDLERAVRAFQRRHGLTADGVVGPRTLTALNVPVEDRIRQIIVNMERWRWLPADLGDRYVLVNLAGFMLEVVEDGRVVLDMPVVVGQPYRSTPVFSDELTYLVINPYWNIPHTIAVEDILPKARRDPGYLVEQGIRVLGGGRGADAVELHPYGVDWWRLGPGTFPFRLRQDPGPRNALGRIKFMLPNKYEVYLHDTPDKHLFEREVRAASSGCIRLADPIAFAEYLLRDHPQLGPGGVRAVIDSGRTLDFRLKDPVPVHLTYSTAWVGEDGTVHFRDDIYGRDARLARALFPAVQTADAT